MACGVHKDALIVRVGPEGYEDAMKHAHTREVDITGRPMTGLIMVDPAGVKSDQDLEAWINQGVEFALKLPPK